VSRTRTLIVVALLVVFVAAGGAIIFAGNRPGDQHLTFDLTVTGASKMTASMPLEARQGDTITMNVTSDEDGEVHLHVYDIPFELKAGQTVSQTFKADKTGTCLIEWEETGAPLGNLIVSP
jgi:hypothetical protein